MSKKNNPKIGHNKNSFLSTPVEHVDITSFDARKIIDSMEKMSFTSRDTAKASKMVQKGYEIVKGSSLLAKTKTKPKPKKKLFKKKK